MKKLWTSYIADSNVKWCSHFKSSLAIPQRVKIGYSNDPAITLLDVYQREMKTFTWKLECTCVFMAALCMIVKNKTTHIFIKWWINE